MNKLLYYTTYLTLLSLLILRLLRYCCPRTLQLKNIFLYVKKLDYASLGLRQDITFIMHGYSTVSACFHPIIPAMILLVTTISTIPLDGFQSSWKPQNSITTINIFTSREPQQQLARSTLCTKHHLHAYTTGNGAQIPAISSPKMAYINAQERPIFHHCLKSLSRKIL